MIEQVGAWRRTLAPIADDPHELQRERLRATLQNCRTYCNLLSNEIARDLPNYTLHNQVHTDSLWDLADLIAGDGYPLTPTEAFVFGCAVLMHDLAMTSSAFSGEPRDEIGTSRWLDLLHVHYLRIFGHRPTDTELKNPPEVVRSAATTEVLRESHAEQASRLPNREFRNLDASTGYYLISDVDLRNQYGDLIGRIAASHWWDQDDLVREFDPVLGAPGIFPRDWTVDPLKVSCLLRTADAGHIDASRTPGLLRAVRKIQGTSSSLHWVFQERLQRPCLDGDRLTFSASRPFGIEDADAWWLCVDTLRSIDRELRSVDALLADSRRPRLAAKSVAYAENLARLARLIPVRDWYPIDAHVRVGDVIGLVKKLGGAELYGDNPQIALRELVSNAADAIRARRRLDSSASELRFRIQVELTKRDEKVWLSVVDNGIGMSLKVMSGPLLDFGYSYWTSTMARRDLPGLLSSGFTPTGKYGIGFFAVFMLGTQVKVRSRRFDSAQEDSYVLEFRDGIEARPILRKAAPDEIIPLGGTQVSVELPSNVHEKLRNDDHESLKDLCSWLFPSLDVSLEVKEMSDSFVGTVEINDWQSISARSLLDRLQLPGEMSATTEEEERLMPLYDNDMMVGRLALLSFGRKRLGRHSSGIVTVGGVRSQTTIGGARGLLLGEPLTAARDSARPIAPKEEIARWADEQAQIIAQQSTLPESQLEHSEYIYALGGHPGELVVAQCRDGYLNTAALKEWAANKDMVHLYQDAAFHLSIEQDPRVSDPHSCLDPDVLVVAMGMPGFIQLSRASFRWSDSYWRYEEFRTLTLHCLIEVGQTWGLSRSKIIALYEEMNKKFVAYEKSTRDLEAGPGYRRVAVLPSGKVIQDRTYSLDKRGQDLTGGGRVGGNWPS